jgi:hypothetical protein
MRHPQPAQALAHHHAARLLTSSSSSGMPAPQAPARHPGHPSSCHGRRTIPSRPSATPLRNRLVRVKCGRHGDLARGMARSCRACRSHCLTRRQVWWPSERGSGGSLPDGAVAADHRRVRGGRCEGRRPGPRRAGWAPTVGVGTRRWPGSRRRAHEPRLARHVRWATAPPTGATYQRAGHRPR